MARKQEGRWTNVSKSVYSLVLSDDVVAAVDRAAYGLDTSRSNLINQLLADYVSFITPEKRRKDIFDSLASVLDSFEPVSYTHLGGQNDRKGAASKAGQVVDGSDPLRTIGHDRHLQWQKYKDYAQYSTFSIKKANYTKENCQQILGKYAEKSALDLTFLTKTIWSER